MSSGKPALRAYHALLEAPWAMTPAMLQTMVDVALRENLDPQAVAAQLGRPLDNSHSATVRDGVATIPVEGPLSRYMSMFTAISGGTSIEQLAQDLTAALADPAVAAICLAIDSPGGEVNGTAEFADMLYQARGQKPLVAYISDMGASAAYWIASACDAIVVAPTALVGSLGIIAGVPDPSKRATRTIEFISSQSPAKRSDPTTEGGRARIQAVVDALADVFLAAVARNRGVDVATVAAEFGQGDVFVGAAAVAAGLADRVGSYEGVIAELATEAGQARRREMVRVAAGGRAQGQETGRMDWKAFWGGLIGAAKDADAEPAAAEAEADAAQPGADIAALANLALPDAEKEALKAQLAAIAAERAAEAERAATERETALTAAAKAFADAEVRAGRALPAEANALTSAYLDAARDDAAHGPLAVADGDPDTRVERLKALQLWRQPHALTTALVKGDAQVLENPAVTTPAGEDKPMSAERKATLYQHLPELVALLKEQGGK